MGGYGSGRFRPKKAVVSDSMHLAVGPFFRATRATNSGVATGIPIWEALEKCPAGIYVKRDCRWYEMLSRMMLDVVRELSPRITVMGSAQLRGSSSGSGLAIDRSP